jgi:saccharopine dehydrogenase (NAD+, L-lysine-forming)
VPVRVLVIGTGGVGSTVGPIAQRRSFFERITFADVDPKRAQALVDLLAECGSPHGVSERRP